MAKAIALTPDALRVPQHTPQAATPARSHVEAEPAPKPKVDHVPLQVRLPRDEARAIKIAAVERDQTISEFVRTCINAYLKK